MFLAGSLCLATSYVAYVEYVSVGQTSPEICGKQSIQLADRSTVTLNADACITTQISRQSRVVRLESGEALFQVARDPSRPFVVVTGPLSVEALATQFDVYRKAVSTRVTVIEGAVQVTAHDATSRSRPNLKPLTPLQQLDIPDDTAQPIVRKPLMTPSDVVRITAWVNGKIILDNTTLKEALDEFARYEHFEVDYQDYPYIAGIRFDGTFDTNAVDRFLDLVEIKCIQHKYDKVKQQIRLAPAAGKRAGTLCP